MGQVFDTLDAALANIDSVTTGLDTATTNLHNELLALVDRVKADDLAPGELEALVTHAANAAGNISNTTTSVSDAAAVVAGVEPSAVPLPGPIEEIPPVEEPPA